MYSSIVGTSCNKSSFIFLLYIPVFENVEMMDIYGTALSFILIPLHMKTIKICINFILDPIDQIVLEGEMNAC